MCLLSIKVSIRKKSGNLFNDPRVYIYIYACGRVCVCVCYQLFMSLTLRFMWSTQSSNGNKISLFEYFW